MSLLVVDVGTSGVRGAIVEADGSVHHVHHVQVLPDTPFPGLVEFDASALADAVLDVAGRSLADAGSVEAVGIANQRASTIVWDRASSEPVGPGIGWQDLRTVGTCLELQAKGFRLAPNASATKVAAILDQFDPDRSRAERGELAFGTVDSWVAWILSDGQLHISDASNAGVTGLVHRDGSAWDAAVLEELRIPASMLPNIVDSTGVAGEAVKLPGRPPIAGIAGDQQASLVGQGCTRPGLAKATFGTGGMLDQCVGAVRPSFASRGDNGTIPIVAWRRDGRVTWGIEAIMLSAGTCVEWLRDDLGLIDTAAASDQVAAACPDTGDVWFVPALLGLGTPVWDFGARGTYVGITRGTGRPQMVRAVLEGVAHRGCDLLLAAEADSGLPIDALRIDGGMSANDVFTQALADACGRPIEISPVLEATTLGAAYLAGLAIGTWKDEDDIAGTWTPRRVVEPSISAEEHGTRRERWLRARIRSEATIPELSGLDF
ncbi:MAG TPA: FGGY-family carbohydrate kinase [Acidimicrobiales bacterium]|jgi:glycerol kinase|nr:FGGY-family carbohydrate kinase [Acidimicrobiales bacterium]